MVPSLEDVVYARKNKRAAEHERRPVPVYLCISVCTMTDGWKANSHVLQSYGIVQRPCVKEQHRRGETERNYVDRQSVAAKRPSSRRKWFAEESTPDEAGDGDGVGEEDRDGSEGVECVERRLRTCSGSVCGLLGHLRELTYQDLSTTIAR